MVLGRLEGGRRTRRTSTTDNAPKIFILKPIVFQGFTKEIKGSFSSQCLHGIVNAVKTGEDNDFYGFFQFLNIPHDLKAICARHIDMSVTFLRKYQL